MTSTVDNRFFARLSTTLSGHEPETLRRLRQENLAGLSGRVLEVGAGTGTNFEFYPATVDEVVAVEPERRLAAMARQAATTVPVPVTVSPTRWRILRRVTVDAVVCWLRCVRSTNQIVFCGNYFRCCVRVANCAISNMSPAPAAERGCRRSSTRRCGRGCWATVTPIGTPKRPSSMPVSGCSKPVASGRFRPGFRCRYRSSRSAARSNPPKDRRGCGCAGIA